MQLTKIQRACLEFCIELPNQSITQREHDRGLVCALGVRGVTKDG